MKLIEGLIKHRINSFEFDFATVENLTVRDKIKYSLDRVEYFLWDSRILWKVKGERNIYYFSCCGWDSSIDSIYKYDRCKGILEKL